MIRWHTHVHYNRWLQRKDDSLPVQSSAASIFAEKARTRRLKSKMISRRMTTEFIAKEDNTSAYFKQRSPVFWDGIYDDEPGRHLFIYRHEQCMLCVEYAMQR